MMSDEFEMSKFGELNFFLGLQVKQTDDGMFISQSKYARTLVKRFELDGSKSAKTPMSTTTKLTHDEDGEDVDPKLCRRMIGSLLYLTASRPDLCLSVGICARYQAKPKKSHLQIGEVMLMIDEVLLEVVSFLTLSDYGINLPCFTAYCDNTSAINISKNPVQHSRTKHIEIRHHFLREQVEKKTLIIEYISTEKQLADIFTKPLDMNRFVGLQKSLGVGEL
ncbi:PREDICTED: uncharacterized protein LOC104798658 [Tarenaya hassleriana]|uniref:uncharacterized protein LOC104798658 n=1 Tax=Tarenaya hassleriana TaxID=28532 RepID=UPI00053C456F|nr:PREDICTED: uncharacterized protein LOC104798658 [Tarenaya hassleriana]